MQKLSTKVNDLTVDELKALITTTVKEVMEELLEDIAALSSDEFLASIQEARKNYREGNVKSFEEVFDV